MNYDDEYLEVFGGDINLFKKVSSKLKEACFEPLEKTKCDHSNIRSFPDRKGYCVDCGEEFMDVSTVENSCKHENVYEDANGLHVCTDCHTELEILNFEPEWRYYGGSDNRSSRDPSRCSRGRPTSRSLVNLFQELKLNIPNAIRVQVEMKYNTIVGKSTVRGKGRKAIIAACLFYTYQDFGEYRTSDYVRSLFRLKRKDMSGGLTKYYQVFPKARTKHTRPEDLLKWLLTLTGVSQEHYRNIVHISKYFKGTSRLLTRSSPQSVASAVIYFYLCLHPEYKVKLGLTKNAFAEKALLSDITVSKLVKEASAIAGCIVNM